MNAYHVLIKKDFRAGTPREAINVVGSLHSLGESITDNPTIIYVAEWDGVADKVTVLKGSAMDATAIFAGWPEVK